MAPQIRMQDFDKPDEVREFPNGRGDIIHLGDQDVTRSVFEPGWRWSNDVKPIAETDWCMFHHIAYVMQGSMQLITSDGEEHLLTAGNVVEIEPGHDAWVVGDTTCVMIDWGTPTDYALPH